MDAADADQAAEGAGRSYGAWKAPQGDGELLIWPEPADLLRDTVENGKLLRGAGHALIQNVPLPEVRRRLRQFLGLADENVPLVATGHQTELHHPGVWVKNAVIDAAATRLSGQALHFAVDTDAPKHLTLRWPESRGPEARGPAGVAAVTEPLTDDPARTTDAWSGRLEPPTPAHVARLAARFESAASGWGFRPMAGDFLVSLRRLGLESVNLSSALTNALHELDWKLGLRYGAMIVSPLCVAEPYLAFVHHVMARAGEFAADYNAALEGYRRRHRIRTPGRPMPNLRCDAGVCEAPFWLDDLTAGSRSRARVVRPDRGGDGRWLLASPRPDRPDPFRFDPSADGWEAAAGLLAWLRRSNLRISPRALTLTSVLRLLAADQFVHGIGGGQYDQVADALIARHFGLTPPRFSVTTATLYFPGAAGQPRVCVPCVVGEGHRLRHGVLGEKKRELVEAIDAAPRGSTERQVLFHQMHRQLAGPAGRDLLRDWERRLAETERREVEERVLFDRELFYAIQPAERLGGLIERCRAAVDGI